MRRVIVKYAHTISCRLSGILSKLTNFSKTAGEIAITANFAFFFFQIECNITVTARVSVKEDFRLTTIVHLTCIL